MQDIGRDGLLRAQPHQFGDGEFDSAADALIRHRSVEALFEQHDTFRRQRTGEAERAVEVLGQAAELAPVLGLAGTLLSLGALPGAVAGGSYAAAISGAVTTTLYGLVLAHFVCAPLAAAIARRATAEESQRRELLEWLAGAVRRLRPAAPAPTEQAA